MNDFLRLIDANINRCREGLRVIEDILRFSYASVDYETVRNIRHRLKKLSLHFGALLLQSRDSETDDGRKVFSNETPGRELRDILAANFKRAEEALRVLEEALKASTEQELISLVKIMRFDLYTAEKTILLAIRKSFDLSLYLVTDSRLCSRPLAETVQDAIKGGVTLVQLREKHLVDRLLLSAAREVLAVCREHQVPCLIDDRVDICLASGADGVHLGQTDLGVKEARDILGQGKIIGKSTHSIRQAEVAVAEPIDYFAFGPLFKTPTKEDYTPVGIDDIESILTLSDQSGIPVVFIGGINLSNLGPLTVRGVKNIAVVREIMQSANPYQSTIELKKIIDMVKS